jgi:RNA-directed DNA polymerase
MVDSQIRLLPEFRRRVEMHVRGVRKFGLAAHSSHRNFDSTLSFINHVDGLLAFGAGVEPAWAAMVGAEWRSSIEEFVPART